MKSLNIVNDKIAELKDTYQHYTAVEKDKAKSSFAKFDIEQFQQIKQDLEDYSIIREIEDKVREGKMVVRNGKKYYASEFILAEQGTIRHLTIWYDDYKKTWYFED